MGDHHPPETVTRRLPLTPRSAASARRFVRAALPGVPPELADTTELLAGELVTNAVLHARTEVDVAVSVRDGRIRVAVSDERPHLGPVPHPWSPCAGAGQGLALVELLASRHGVDTDERRKTVWFELSPDGPSPSPSGWRSGKAPRAADGTVTLADVPDALYTASLQHRHALMRELALAAPAGDGGDGGIGVRPKDLAAAHDVNNALSAWVADAMDEQPSEAGIRSLSLRVPSDAVAAVRTLRDVLGLAEEAAREERLLALPALPRCLLFQEWLFDQITGQLAGGHPTAWTVVPRDPGTSSSELVPWEPGHVRAGRVPTIAADEDNRIIAANGPAADLLGWDTDELVGRKITTLIPEHLRRRHTAAFSSLLLTGRTRIVGRNVPLPALHRHGHVVPVRLLIQTQETADGRTVFVAQLIPRATAAAEAPAAPGASGQSAAQHPDERKAPTPTERRARTSGTEAGMSPVERLSLLADVAAALSDTLYLDAGLRHVARLLTRRLADWCAVDLFTDASQVERVCLVQHDAGAAHPAEYEGPLPPVSETARGPLARALRGAGPLLLTEAPPANQTENALDAHHLALLRRLGTGSAVVAPLRARQEIFGALTLARSRERRPFTEEDLSLIEDLVRGIALGIDNARLYQATRNIAERLQRSLLPALPHVDNLQLAARYAASSTTAQVGGDWYDSFVLPSGGTAVVIGDVTGHNLDAAIAMSQLRSMLRGIAVDRQEPPEMVLRRLDLANHSLYREATATCLYGLVKCSGDGAWELTHSSAGHLPPLLTTREGATRYLEGGAGLLLGMDPEMPRRTARDPLPAGSTLLLYTDGLIERRDESLDDALARLRRHTAALARASLDTFCDELLIRLGADSADDIAVLALRPASPR
ncbi:SpoIIE family protein phosphatase [Streptomyces sp. NPDC052020]|uniref:SpoIIE family protein phosphatase n=1 Tax=Streptomyces sp. NPDC052020 TaxID=3155677 RepID=UPI00343C1963